MLYKLKKKKTNCKFLNIHNENDFELSFYKIYINQLGCFFTSISKTIFCKNSFTSIYSICSNLIDMKKVFKKFLTIMFLLTLTAGLVKTLVGQGADNGN